MRKYRIAIAYRFHFDPRQVDEWTCQEFDEIAAMVDEISREEDKQRRQAEAAGSRSGRRR